jgi:hypothetical protein
MLLTLNHDAEPIHTTGPILLSKLLAVALLLLLLYASYFFHWTL